MSGWFEVRRPDFWTRYDLTEHSKDLISFYVCKREIRKVKSLINKNGNMFADNCMSTYVALNEHMLTYRCNVTYGSHDFYYDEDFKNPIAKLLQRKQGYKSYTNFYIR